MDFCNNNQFVSYHLQSIFYVHRREKIEYKILTAQSNYVVEFSSGMIEPAAFSAGATHHLFAFDWLTDWLSVLLFPVVIAAPNWSLQCVNCSKNK